MTLVLSKTVIEGLKYLGVTLNVDLSRKLIANVVKLSVHQDENIPSNPEIYALKPDHAKQSEYAVVTLLFLATKYDYDSQKLRTTLEKYDLVPIIIEELVKIFEQHKKDLIVNNLKIGYCVPHITDIHWKLQCDIKSSTIDSNSGELHYNINLGRHNEKTGEYESIVEFMCNVEELQALINRLKEIERHCERLSMIKSHVAP